LQSSWITERDNIIAYQEAVNKGLSVQDLLEMDESKDGKVDLIEYIEYMLVSSGKVEKKFTIKIKAHFDKLDKDGSGALDKEDFEFFILKSQRKLGGMNKKQYLDSLALGVGVLHNDDGSIEQISLDEGDIGIETTKI